MTPQEWSWRTVPDDVFAPVEEAVRIMLGNVRRGKLVQTGFTHPNGERWQKTVGIQGEVAFHWMTGRRIPSPKQLASTWDGPDVPDAGLQIKTVSTLNGPLCFQNKDVRHPDVRGLVLMFNPIRRPWGPRRFAIIGRISKERALQQRVWGDWLPWPAWVVEQDALDPWAEKERT